MRDNKVCEEKRRGVNGGVKGLVVEFGRNYIYGVGEVCEEV